MTDHSSTDLNTAANRMNGRKMMPAHCPLCGRAMMLSEDTDESYFICVSCNFIVTVEDFADLKQE